MQQLPKNHLFIQLAMSPDWHVGQPWPTFGGSSYLTVGNWMGLHRAGGLKVSWRTTFHKQANRGLFLSVWAKTKRQKVAKLFV